MSRTTSAGRPRGTWYTVAVVVLVLGAVAVSWVVTRGSADALAELDPDPVAVSVPVGETVVDFSEPASLSGVPEQAPPVVSSGRSGTVTAVTIGPGDAVASGAPVFAVDGVQVVAYADDAVLFRSLSAGAKGPDVAAAQRVLSVLVPEQAVEATGTMDAATVRLVRAYESALGASSPTGTVDPTWFVHLPYDGYVAQTVEVVAGAPAPAAGEEVLTAAATITEASVSGTTRGPAGPYEFLVSGVAVPLERAEDGTWTVPDLAAAASVLLSGEVPAQGPVRVEGRTRFVDGAPGQSVPGASVVTDESGATCVVLADTREPVAVTVLGASLNGAAQLAPDLPSAVEVLVNPLQVVGDVTCP